MNILFWVLFGIATGFMANLIDPSPTRGGILGTIVLGILGALVGGFLGNLLFDISVTGFNATSLILAVLGSLLLLTLERALSRRQDSIDI